MTSMGQSSSKNKDDEGNDSKKNLVNGIGSTHSQSGTNDMSTLRRSARELSNPKMSTSSLNTRKSAGESSNPPVSTSSPSTRKSERLVKHKSVSPVINRKSMGLKKQLTPSPLKRSDRGKKHTSSPSSGLRKFEKASIEVSRSEDPKPARGKVQKLNGRTFKALFKAQRSTKDAADRNGTKPLKRDEVVEETSPTAEKMLVDYPREELLETPELVGCDSIGKSLDDGNDKECDSTKVSKRKRDLVIDFDASVIDANAIKDLPTSSSDDLRSSTGCQTHNDFQTCAACSKRRRVDQDAHGQDFCYCSTLIANISQEASRNEDMEQLESRSATEFAEKCDGRTQLKEIHLEIQTEATESRCLICKLGGKLMFCDGKDCKTSCHPSCLDPSIDDAPAGAWHCFQCVNNKTQADARRLSESVESIWNAREVEVSNGEGLWKEKQYFVKYRGLAHTHNQWIPESQLLLEAAEVVEEYNRNREVVKWNEEWVLPQRLLKKRLLSSPKQKNEAADGISGSCSEWLVKWRGLNYESVTWELDNADCLCSAHGQKLIKEYETRQKKALDDPCSVDKDKNGSLDKLQKLPAGNPGLDTNHLDTLNKLREFRHRGQNAVVFDDQDRITKILLYIISLSDVCQPFLIVTTSSLLPVWEAEFSRVAPSVDVVVYDGSSNNRKSIRTLEFYGEGGRIILQVLLSSIEVVVEDLLFFESMKWKVLILDECQQSSISSQFEQIKLLATDVKILLFSGPLKDNVAEHLNLLSLLDSCDNLINIEPSKMQSSENLFKLKERLSGYIACECKSSSSKFVEFWVPCMISNVQLEQYCATLLSNSISLCLYSKTDPVGALRDILFSTRKSCDHPYIVDPSLKSVITKDVPPIKFLDVDIKASGKLQLLEMMLLELKRRQLRVLILFQSVAGSGRDTFGLGDILDDFLRERFGLDSFERVDGAISSKTRQAAMNNFNKGSGRFVFLLENRACLPSIRLVSVDTIIIFDSDWNPANDIKALNKVSIDSKFKQIKIFRLYSPFTVEEKVLVLAKQGSTLESKLQNISRTTSNTLLMWGASYLLNRLNEIHSTSDVQISSEQALSSKVVDEIMELLSENGECDDCNNSFILKIQQRGGIYCSNLKLFGEQEVQLSDGEHAPTFWTNLLNGRNPTWKFLTQQTQRHRKKVQYFMDSPKKPESEAVEVGKKRKKVGGNHSNPSSLNRGLELDKAEGGASGIQGGDDGSRCLERSDASAKKTLHNSNAFEKSTFPDARKNLHLLLKPDILKLCEILKLSDEVKVMVDRFLRYVIANRQVHSEEVNILQALLISLCWNAASFLKQKVDRRESLSLAKHHLNFICSEDEADCLYTALRKLKKPFLVNMRESEFSKDNNEKFIKGPVDERMLQSSPFDSQNVKIEVGEIVSNGEIARDDEMGKDDTQKNSELIQRKCQKRIAKLKQKQAEEIQEFNRDWEAKVVRLENTHRVESAIIREMYSHKSLRIDKLKALENDYTKKMDELKFQKDASLEQLKAKHLDALSDENKKVARWLSSATSSAIEVAGQDEPLLFGSDIQNRVGYCQASEQGSLNVSESDATLSKNPDVFSDNTHIGKMVPGNTSAIDPNQDIGWNITNDTVTIIEDPNSRNEVENPGSVDEYIARSQQPNRLGSSINVDGNTDYTSQQSGNENPDSILVTGSGGMILPEPLGSIAEEVGGDANSLELDTAAVEPDGENDRLGGVSPETPNVVKNHPQSGEANNSVGLDSTSSEMLKQPDNQPVPSPTCDQAEVLALQPDGAEEVNHLDHEAPLVGVVANVEQLQPELPSDSVSGHSTPQTPNEHTPLQGAEAFCQLSENGVELSGQLYSPTGQNVERNSLIDDRGRPLADKQLTNQPNDSQIPQEMVEHTAVLPNQVLRHLGVNVELHCPTDVLETHLHQNHPDFPSNSRSDHQPVNLNASFLNAEAVPQVVENTIELPSQAGMHTRVNMPVVQGHSDLSLRAENQVPSRIPTVTSYCDPLQNEMEGIRKEIEQAIKIHEDAKVRLKSELEELIAQLHRRYESKLKDAEAEFLRKKKELDSNHKKVLMNKILADAFRSKCVEPSRNMAIQQVVHQHLQQLPLHTPTRSSPIVVSSSDGQPSASSRLNLTSAASMDCQPASSKQNTTPISQSASRIHPVNASSTAGQPEASQLNTAPIWQHVSRFHPVNASFIAGQPAASQQNIAPILQTASRLNPSSGSSTASQPATSQQNAARVLQSASRLPVTVPSSGSQPAAKQQHTTALTQQRTTVLTQHEPGDNLIPVLTSADQPAASQHNTARQLQASARTAPIFVSSTGQPAVSQQSTPPPLQIVHQSAALFSITPTRPPQINPITPSIGNLRVGSENRARAPAPHLQAFRSGSSSTQRTMPSHLTPNSLPVPSSHALHAPVSSGASPIPTKHSNPFYSRPLQSNTKDMLPPESTPSSASVSRHELLKDIHRHHIPQRLDDDPPLPDLGSKLDSIDFSVFDSGPSMAPGSTPADVTTSVIRLPED